MKTEHLPEGLWGILDYVLGDAGEEFEGLVYVLEWALQTSYKGYSKCVCTNNFTNSV